MEYFSTGVTKDKLMVLHGLKALGMQPTKEQLSDFFGIYDLLGYFAVQNAAYAAVGESDGGYKNCQKQSVYNRVAPRKKYNAEILDENLQAGNYDYGRNNMQNLF